MACVQIVLATYNGEKYIREQLDSLINQTYEDFEVRVCDDGSVDGTTRIVEEYAKKDARISLHRNITNGGYVRNFMDGIRKCRAPYIMLCDQDDIWNPDKIEKTLRKMQQLESKKAGKPLLVFTDAMNYDSKTGKELGSFHKNSHLNVKKVDTPHLFMENKCIGCTIMINHEVLPYVEETPDAVRVHDWWLALICSHFGAIGYVNETTLKYRQHGGNMIGGSSYSHYVKGRVGKIQRQREVLRKTYEQAAVFLHMFEDGMTDRQKKIARAFADMEKKNWFMRRKNMIQYGFYKSGLIRNIGLFLLL